jgi:uncharacterized protein YjdB
MDSTTGALTAITGSPFAAHSNPTSLAMDPTGEFLYVASNENDAVYTYLIDVATGVLDPVPGEPFSFAGFGNPDGITTTSGATASPTAALISLQVVPVNPSIPNAVVGETQQFTATGTYSDGTTQFLTASATWSSSNAGAAAISNTLGSNGLATSTDLGSTTITATFNSISGSTTLTFSPASLVSITVTPTNPTISLGTAVQFTATGNYSDGTTQNLTNSATWSSTNTSAATTSNAAGSNGLATGVSSGSTTITATSASVSGTSNLTIQ